MALLAPWMMPVLEIFLCPGHVLEGHSDDDNDNDDDDDGGGVARGARSARRSDGDERGRPGGAAILQREDSCGGGPRQGVPLLEGRERIGGERGSGRGLTSYLSFRAAAALPAGWDTEWGGQGALSGSRAAAEKGTREFSPSARNWPRLLSPHFIAEAFGLRRQVPSLV